MNAPIILIRYGTALTMILFGLHQYARPGAWLGYIPDWMKRTSPLKPETSMRLHSLGNIVFGLFLASAWHPLLAAWVAMLWWASILPFAFKLDWRIGLRDLTITLGLVALICLVK